MKCPTCGEPLVPEVCFTGGCCGHDPKDENDYCECDSADIEIIFTHEFPVRKRCKTQIIPEELANQYRLKEWIAANWRKE